MMKYIEEHKVGRETAFLAEVEKNGKKTFKAGISSYGYDAVHSPRTTSYSTFEEAQEDYEWCKHLVDNTKR